MNMKKSLASAALTTIVLLTTNANAVSPGNAAALEEIRSTAGSICQLTEVNKQVTEVYVDAAANNLLGLGIDVSGGYYNHEQKGAAIDEIITEIDPENFYNCNLQVFHTLSALLLVPESKSMVRQSS